MVEQLPENVNDNVLMGFSFEHLGLMKGPILIPFWPKHASTGIHNAHQYLKYNDFLKDKHCIIQIHNDDKLCFARALIVSRAYVHKKDPNTV
uniref:Uncharacterized protein n=1 Tax=Romanomermis culicivorax TaxID=13658 RepID=A0A915HQ66_ROMCU